MEEITVNTFMPVLAINAFDNVKVAILDISFNSSIGSATNT